MDDALPLLASKLTAPPPPEVLVPRPRLTRLLDAGVCGPVSLIAAPAGWGKTVLLASWARAQAAERAVGWVSVEPNDGAEDFWAYLRAALATLDVDSGGDSVRRMADALTRLTRPAVVILDDLHLVTDPGVLDGLDFLLRHAEGRLRLVVGARAEPTLGLHRWRLDGGLTELAAHDLAFTREETAALLARHGVPASRRQVDDLQVRTEGWPAGLRFAARALRAHPDPDRYIAGFGGDDPSVAGYLVNEVLRGQPAEVRDVLLRTSIAERVWSDLADALTGRHDATRVLAELERTNGFVVPLGTRPAAYRYHRMFGELLRAELGRHAPEQLTDLHRRAAAWHAARDMSPDALRHALAAQDWDRATSVLLRHWPELVPYDRRAVPSAPTPPPPPDAVRADPELALAYAAELLDGRDLATADDYLRLAHRHRDRLADDRKPRFTLIAAALRFAEAQLGGDRDAVLGAARRLLDLVRLTDPAEAGTRAVALTAIAVAELDAGDLVAAESALTSGLTDARDAGLSRARLACASRLALVRAVRGELRAAEEIARTALAAPAYSEMDRGFAHLALAVVALHRDRLADAEANVALVPHGPGPALVALAAMLRAELLRSRGDPAAGYRALAAARDELAEPPPGVARWLATAEAELRTAQGDPVAARDLLGGAEGHAARLALARAHLCAGDPVAAARALPAAPDLPLLVRVDAGVLDAVAARRAGDHRRAARTLEAALRLAEPEGLRYVFTRAGPEVREMLADHLDAGTAHWPLVSALVAAVEPGPPEAAAPAGDALTDRELTVLRYLQSMLSNVEIARELSVSVNTVKTHVRNIYRKLAATRRRDAVRRGRELRLI
ncbi:LuxR C-terminal-related transcriptional regulator [Phytohabitans rumicis]|uniref:LuxR family transcriptional regulator n=1 Tax=Phytohabitans rumicis TaxID=1076125 RepID=A0A6V8LDI8_9ACTN|nr:LuxR C-terminal-related transcriptional regulator [Phytohabitans rumicis]GFJ94384.1 LuxR family transcriptional regulator [Phytohabitans rumicis]